MSVERIANRYALTLIEAAEDQQKIDEVYNDALTVQSAMKDSRDLVLLLESPIIGAEKKYKALDAIFAEHIGELFLSFIEVICKKGREPYMQDIIDALKEEYKKHKSITEVEVITATEVDDATLQKIEEKVKTLPYVRDHIEMQHKVDPEIIGGLVIRYDDKVYDASVAHDLEKLRRQIAG
jgi:F-type H+-transporting ATPase subunit delta